MTWLKSTVITRPGLLLAEGDRTAGSTVIVEADGIKMGQDQAGDRPGEVGIESSGIPGMTLNRLPDTNLYR